MTLKEAAMKVLSEHDGPMRTCDIWAAILGRGFYAGEGRTPYRTLTARLTLDISKNGSKSTFVRQGFGLYVLRDRTHRNKRTRS
jgi:restriction system protein